MTGILVGTDARIHVGWFGIDGEPSALVPGFGPDGSATLVLDLENGFRVRLQYSTDIQKSRSGKEQRRSRNDVARESYAGSAVLLGSAVATTRDKLQRYATLGWPFLLALPHEALMLRADASGETVYVVAAQLALIDWGKAGQRVVVVHEDEDGEIDAVDAVIQSTGSNSITLDIAPGDIGARGGQIMPARPVYLEPQQDFGRSEAEDQETWQIEARAMVFDFAMTLASLDLGPITTSAALENAGVVARVAGSAPTFELVMDAGVEPYLVETADAVTLHYRAPPFPQDAGDLYDLLQTSSLIAPTGTWGPGDLDLSDNTGAVPLTGGDASGVVGTGATLTEYADRPVWDRPIAVSGSVSDSIHALTEILDFGGAIYAKGFADAPDGARTVQMLHGYREEWQWLKLFLSTVKGRQKAWWLPTWRADLELVSFAGADITVSGDVAAWYPRQRQHIYVREYASEVTYCEITAAVDNGDGTWTLTTDATFTDPNRVGWLDLCRFESDDFDVTWGQRGLSFLAKARAVQR